MTQDIRNPLNWVIRLIIVQILWHQGRTEYAESTQNLVIIVKPGRQVGQQIIDEFFLSLIYSLKLLFT